MSLNLFKRPEGTKSNLSTPISYTHNNDYKFDTDVLLKDHAKLKEKYNLNMKKVITQPKTLTAANYAEPDDDFTLAFLEQNKSQIWFPEEIPVNDDLPSWHNDMTKEKRETFEMVLGGLTLLDTIQGDIGMNRLVSMVDGHQRKALINFMAMMENVVHAASYSTIFLTLSDVIRIKEIFNWIEDDKNLQFKAGVIEREYNNMEYGDDVSVFRGMVASVFLESFLFYSGFYYPLYLAGNGEMRNSGEIINLILRDESIKLVVA